MSVKVKFFKIEYVKDIEVTENSGVVITVKKYKIDEISDEMWDALLDIGDWFDAITIDGETVILNLIDTESYEILLNELREEGEHVDLFLYNALSTIEEWKSDGIYCVEREVIDNYEV